MLELLRSLLASLGLVSANTMHAAQKTLQLARKQEATTHAVIIGLVAYIYLR